jgi:spore coat protein U-like protein
MSYSQLAHSACTVTTTAANFGNYNVFTTTTVNTTGTIRVTCSPRANIQIAIGASPNSGGFNPRSMKLTTGTDLLNYNLYTNSARTTIWGDGTSGTSVVIVNNVSNTTRTVYGRIPALQDVRAGSYSETLTVTVTY